MAQGERHRRSTDTSGLHQTKQFKVFLVERRASIFYQVSSNCHACSQATTTAPIVIDLVCFDKKVETARNSPNFKSTLSLSRPHFLFLLTKREVLNLIALLLVLAKKILFTMFHCPIPV
jgi:hypothetical protein